MQDTDYKKMWRSEKKQNVVLHNQNFNLTQNLKEIMGIAGVKELVTKHFEGFKKLIPQK